MSHRSCAQQICGVNSDEHIAPQGAHKTLNDSTSWCDCEHVLSMNLSCYKISVLWKIIGMCGIKSIKQLVVIGEPLWKQNESLHISSQR